MNKKIWLMLLIFSLFIFSGCAKNSTDEDSAVVTAGTYNQDLDGLIPSQEGFKWHYFGTADYGHTMWIDKTYQSNSQKIIKIKGEVDNQSDNNSADYGISVTYAIEPDRIVQTKISEAMMDSEYDKLTLIMAPLQQGTKWNEEVIDSQGKKVKITGEITEVIAPVGEAGTIYKILYSEDDSDYSEVRKIQENVGVVEFLKTMKYQTESLEVGYHLYKTEQSKSLNNEVSSADEDQIKGVIFNFDDAWARFVTNGSEDIYQYMVEDSPAYQAVKGFIPSGKKQKFETIEVKSVTVDGLKAKAKVFEKLRQEKDGNVEFIEYNWIYSLSKIGEQWYVEGYVEDGGH